MNYKKLKRVFALGMAVLLSVSTSVYGGTMEVHAAEVISDDLLENEVIDNSSLEENTEKKGDVQGDTQGTGQGDSQDNAQDAGQDDGQDNAQNAGQGDSNDNVQNTEQGDSNDNVQNAGRGDSNDDVQNAGQGDSSDDVQNAGQDDSQDNAQDAGQGTVQGDAQDAGQDATVLTEQDEKPAALAATMAAPSGVAKTEVGYSNELNLGFSDAAWVNSITALKVGNDSFEKVNSFGFFESGNKFIAGSYSFDGGANGDLPALRIITKNITFPVIAVISANGYEDLKLNIKREGKSYAYTYTAEVISDTTPDTPAAQTYTVTTSGCANGTLSVTPNTEVAENTSVTVTATPNAGYVVDTVTAKKDDGTEITLTAGAESGVYTFTMPASNVTVSATFKEAAPAEAGKIVLSQLKLEKEWMGSNWNLKFTNADGYVSKVTAIKVNDTAWKETSYGPYSGGSYKKNTDENYLIFAGNDNISNPTIRVLQSGDVITITATGYQDLTFKLVIDPNGNASLTEDDNQGDPYELHVKIEGSFEAAIVGQKDYDGVSSASTGGASSNKNSAVTVYGALVQKDTEPADSDWEALDHQSKIQLEGSKCSVSIVPDVAGGTAANSDSGMEGVYMTLSSDLTLNGTPKDPGTYLISVSIEDKQGRKATSNTLPFRIYSGEETLAEQIETENLKQYASGLYAWDIMEPWAIKNFGSNVEGQEESVRVPEKLEVWFGSHESGTYGFLGYDIPWADVKAGNIPQTLYIPAGCNLTLTNMKILSSVRIIVENGGKLTLSDSTVQGIIDVQSGGTFSMNYDAYGKKFTTGASICGQLRLEDGAILENAAIYSHTNYLANGDLTDRSNDDAIVAVTGNVTLKGQVFISGDEAGSTGKGQTALQVKNGTLNLEDGATLATYGGGGNVTIFSTGGEAIQLENGTITGNGKVIAIGGSVTFGTGGNAVSGNGAIHTSEVFLQGATSYTAKNAAPGKALEGDIALTSAKRHVADGTQVESGQNDPLADLYWKTGIDSTPSMDQFVTADTKSFMVSDIPSQVYTGNELQPQITVMDEGILLTEGTDYVVTCKQVMSRAAAASMMDAGTYTVVVSGTGVYGGSVEKAFVIEPKKTIFAVTEDASSAVYDGQNKRPTVTVKDGDAVLAEGIDYEITVSVDGKEYTDAEFVAAGVYEMTITGIGNYEGSTGKVSFTISEKSSDQNSNDNDNNSNTGNTTDNGNNSNTGNTTDNGSNTNTDSSAANNSKKKKKHSSHGNSSEETTAQAAAESSAVADISAVPATGDMAQTGQWMLLGAASLAAIGISLETRRKKRK
ncbi:InlB B-repeat-containing protein [Hominiventricola filiformis]|uniref:Bacterial repeat domain-containing protein n=1 Tax=Hominiventricola filiformis TaxID=2885352 RepID=A0AAE3A2P2_9FIRM|nr:hypothetical protein [Hominiventricola filiformis]MCC2124981.1 hypothetical protein [Hominiventricola filiformis]